MNYLHAITLGIVEGMTEFLPISSTAHLIIVSKLLRLPSSDFQKFFEVFIQSGAILAIILIYFEYILKHKEILKKIGLSFIPTAIIGFLLYKVIKTIFFESGILIIMAMFSVGILFFVLEYFISSKKISLTRSLNGLTFAQAVFIGLAQSLAVVPGVSRSGIVMLYMMLVGYKRDEAALYSFLLAAPTIIATSGDDLFKMRHIFNDSIHYLPLLLVGLITSFLVAYVVIKWFIGFLKNNSLVPFGIYRVVLAIILLFIR